MDEIIIELFLMNLLIQYAKDNNKNLIVIFLDYSKAFDYTNRMLLIKDLMNKGCGSTLTKAIASMYIDTDYIPRLNNNMLSDTIKTKYGVTQGLKSSAPLFSFYVSDMKTSLNNITTKDYIWILIA